MTSEEDFFLFSIITPELENWVLAVMRTSEGARSAWTGLLPSSLPDMTEVLGGSIVSADRSEVQGGRSFCSSSREEAEGSRELEGKCQQQEHTATTG